MSERSMVANAADRKQVRRADHKAKERRRQELDDIRAVLAIAAGRRFIWSRLEKCGVFRSIWAPSALIHFNEGRRDIGLELMADLAAADEEAFFVMMQEARVQTRRDRIEQEQEEKRREDVQKAKDDEEELP